MIIRTLKSKYNLLIHFSLVLNFSSLRKFPLARIVIVFFSFPVNLMLSFAVLQGALDVL